MYASSYASFSCFFFFHDPATTEIYTLSLHDALPILLQAFDDPQATMHPDVVVFEGRSDDGDRALEEALCFGVVARSEEHTSELQSQSNLVCRLLLEKKKYSSFRLLQAAS